MYLMKAPERFGKYGEILDHKVVDGVALVQKQYYYHLMRRQGWEDLTPSNWKRAHQKPDNMKNILFVHHSGIGDALFMTPLFRAVKEKYPNLTIHLATNMVGAQVCIKNPYVDHIILNEEKQLPHYINQFDDVVNLDGCITKFHEANIVNVYDLFADHAGIELPDDRKKPEIFLTDAEKRSVEKLLREKGLRGAGNLVVIQLESSSLIRSLEKWKMVEVGLRLKKLGYEIFIFSNTPLGECVYHYCASCGRPHLMHLPKSLTAASYKCRCGSVESVDASKRGVEGLTWSDDSMSIRMIDGIIQQAAAVIGPDSCGVHLAAAHEVPCLGLYSSFDADLRMRYYRKGRWIQKPYSCAPCFNHHSDCHNTPGNPGCCMQLFQVDEIVEETLRMLRGEKWERPAPFNFNEIRQCPSCGGNKVHYRNRKGNVLWVECLKCGTAYTSVAVPLPENNTSYYEGFLTADYIGGQVGAANTFHKKFYRPGQLNRVLDIGCGVAHTINRLAELGWDIMGIEHAPEAIRFSEEKYPLTRGKIIITDPYTFKSDEKFSLVWMNAVFEHLNYPRPLVENIWHLLEDDGILSIQVPDLRVWRQVQYDSRWTHVNNSYVGEHCLFMDPDTMQNFMRTCGFEPHSVEPNPGPDCFWINFKKVESTNNGTEK